MAKSFEDPFPPHDQTAIDGVLTSKDKSQPWSGYTYKDAKGETWDLMPLVKDSKQDNKLVIPIGGLLQTILGLKSSPDQWRATLPATKDHQSIALYSKTMVSTLEDIDNATYRLKLEERKSGALFWLVIIGAALWAKKKGKL